MMKLTIMQKSVFIAPLALLCSLAAQADVSEQDAIRAQVSSAMASADYAQKNCRNLRVDEDRLGSLIKRSGMSADALRASEDYAEQRDVIQSLAKGSQGRLICVALVHAHGGYARDIIVER